MATTRRTTGGSARPRETRDAGTSAVNASDVRGPQEAWQRRELVLFLGAGVSMPFGVPSWKNLVMELLFDQTEAASRLRGLLPHSRRTRSPWSQLG